MPEKSASAPLNPLLDYTLAPDFNEITAPDAARAFQKAQAELTQVCTEIAGQPPGGDSRGGMGTNVCRANPIFGKA